MTTCGHKILIYRILFPFVGNMFIEIHFWNKIRVSTLRFGFEFFIFISAASWKLSIIHAYVHKSFIKNCFTTAATGRTIEYCIHCTQISQKKGRFYRHWTLSEVWMKCPTVSSNRVKISASASLTPLSSILPLSPPILHISPSHSLPLLIPYLSPPSSSNLSPVFIPEDLCRGRTPP